MGCVLGHHTVDSTAHTYARPLTLRVRPVYRAGRRPNESKDMTEIEWWEYDDAAEMAQAVAGDIQFIIEAAIGLTERGGVTWQDD